MWTHSQSTGRCYTPDKQLRTIGYSGHEEGKNNPDLQDHPSLGPLPQGMYTMTEIFNSPTHGPDCIRLVPDADNQMFGRAGFLIHGDSIVHPGLASLGCIIYMHDVRLEMWHSVDHRLKVVR